MLPRSQGAGPLFTIVTPVLDGLPWLPEAVASVTSQADVELELIIADGGSTDGSREWLKNLRDDRVTVVLDHDSGQADALARHFSHARGSILGWLNADDLLEQGALARVAAAFREHGEASIVSGACSLIDAAGNVVGRIDPPPSGTFQGLLNYPRNLAQPATFFSAAAYRRTTGIDPRLQYAMDVDLWLKLARLGPAVLLPIVLARFRMHPAAKSSRAATAMVREDLKVRLAHGMPTFSRAARTLFRWAYLRPLRARIRQWLAR